MKTVNTSSLLSQTATAIGIAAFALFSATEAATALSISFDSSSTSTNDPATGASAKVDFSFTDVAGGGVQLDLNLENTTGKLGSSFGSGATESKFVGFGFDLADLITSYDYQTKDIFTRLFGDENLTDNNVEGDAKISGAGGQNIFDIGIRVAGQGTFSGGNPTTGLNAGESTDVSFLLNTQSNAAAVEDAFEALFTGEEFRAVARFQAVGGGQGYNGATSEKLLVNTLPDDGGSGNNGNSTKVPEPSTILGLTLLGGAFAGLRRQKNN